MENTKLYYFLTKAGFLAYKEHNIVPRSAIVFIESPKQVYTHGQFWDGSDVLTAVQNAIKDLDLSKIKDGTVLGTIDGKTFKLGDSITTNGKTYTAGEGIDITGTTIKSKPATSENIGGVKLGYPSSGNNYELKVDGYNRAYVYVPGGDNPVSGENGGFWELIFIASNTMPELPGTNALSSGWDHSVPSNTKKIIWMADRWVDGNGTYGPWQGPWQISGVDGKPGVDGDEFEYIYTRTTVEDRSLCPGLSNSQTDDYVPAGWTDDPQGVSNDIKYEWMAFRKKEHSSTNLDGTWTTFTGPILWSAYGRQGVDGDSVEYIYFAGLNNRWTDNPAYWGNDARFQEDDYVRPNSGWSDDPVDLESASYGPGSKQWVSVRKKRNNMWQAFSSPKLWGYYPNDGRTGNGIVADTDNDMIAVSLDENNANYAVNYGIQMHMYEDASNITITDSEIKSVKWEDGATVSYSNEFVVNNGLLTINIPAETYTFDSTSHGTSIFVTVEITGTTTYGVTKRNIVVLLAGFRFGADGASYKLGTSAKVIRKSKAGVLSPDQLEAWCIKTEGTGNIERWTPSTIAVASSGEFQLKYAINDGSDTTLNLDSITIPSNADTVTISLYYVSGSSYLVDQETIPVIREGNDGTSSVMYQIHLVQGAIRKLYREASNIWQVEGGITFFVTKIEGTSAPYYLDGTQPDVTVEVYLGGPEGLQLSTSMTSLNGNPLFVADVIGRTWDDSFTYTTIFVKEGGIIRAVAVVPTIVNGKNGETVEQQALNYAVTRIRKWKSTLGPDDANWNDGTVVESNSGVRFIDVVTYSGNYYVCKYAGTTSVPGTNTDHWALLNRGEDSAYNMIVSNFMATNSLTAKQVAITDSNENVVAGMVSGNLVSSEFGAWASNNSNGIRIFAGDRSNGSNIADAAFTVDGSGNVKMSGNVNITSGNLNIAGGNVTVNGNLLQMKDMFNGISFSANEQGDFVAGRGNIAYDNEGRTLNLGSSSNEVITIHSSEIAIDGGTSSTNTDLSVKGDIDLSGTIASNGVTANTIQAGNIAASGNVTITGQLNVNDTVNINGDINGGAITCDSILAANGFDGSIQIDGHTLTFVGGVLINYI